MHLSTCLTYACIRVYYVCMYTHICACVCVYTYVYACVCMYTYICSCVSMSTYIYACVCMYTYIHACICMNIQCKKKQNSFHMQNEFQPCDHARVNPRRLYPIIIFWKVCHECIEKLEISKIYKSFFNGENNVTCACLHEQKQKKNCIEFFWMLCIGTCINTKLAISANDKTVSNASKNLTQTHTIINIF